MLNPAHQRKLKTLFNELPLNEEAFNMQSVEGYLYALAITPEVIVPSEWLPVIFGGEMPEYNNMQQVKSMMNAIMNGYNHYNALRMEGRLRFPFDMDQLTSEMFDDIIDWSYGFHQGLRLRRDIWLSRIIAKDLGEEEDPVANSVGVVSALVHDDADSEIVGKIRNNMGYEVGKDDIEASIVATLIRILQESVIVIQEFAAVLDEQRQNKLKLEWSTPVRSEKIGRNEPCPCGSGKKYKKCCGADSDFGIFVFYTGQHHIVRLLLYQSRRSVSLSCNRHLLTELIEECPNGLWILHLFVRLSYWVVCVNSGTIYCEL